MSKAFVKEDAEAPEAAESERSEIPAGGKNYMTPEGYARLKAELKHLVETERPEVVRTVSWAASNGDRSENGDYIYGKRRLREIDRRVRFLIKRLESAQLVPVELPGQLMTFEAIPAPDAVVSIGLMEHVGPKNYRGYMELVDRCLAPGGVAFAKAGTNFQATVGAYLWNSAADTNVALGDGVPDAGATLAQITANGAAPSYIWQTTVSGGAPYTPVGGTSIPWSNIQVGSCPAAAPNCFSSGIATPTNLSYSEVGSFTLASRPPGS